MSSAAYRDAPASPARALAPTSMRTRRRRHVVGIVAAAAVVAITGDTLLGLVCGFAVAAYALGFIAGLQGSDERVSVSVVTVLGVATGVLITASSIPLYSRMHTALAIVVVASALVSSVAAFIGSRRGASLRSPLPSFTHAPLPPKRVASPEPARRPQLRVEKPLRVEAPLDELPESWRAPVFAVRLRRRQLSASRLRES